jgi:hypothetical protein
VRSRATAVVLAVAVVVVGCGAPPGDDEVTVAEAPIPASDPGGSAGSRQDLTADDAEGGDEGSSDPPASDDDLDPPASVGTPPVGGGDLCEVIDVFGAFTRDDPPPDEFDRFFDLAADHYVAVAAAVPGTPTGEAAVVMAEAFTALADEARTVPAAARADEVALERWLSEHSDTFVWLGTQFDDHGHYGLPDPDGSIEACETAGNVPG